MRLKKGIPVVKMDLVDLARKIAADHNARLTRAQTMALIVRIRELEEALSCYGNREHDGTIQKILEKGTVAPK